MNTLTPLKHVAEVSGRVGWHGLSTDDYLTEGEFLVTGTDIRNGKVAWESCHRVSESRWSQDPRIQLGHGDVLITKDGTIGKIALVRELSGRATLNSGVFRVRPSEQLLGGYLFRVLESRLFTDFVNLQGHGSTINHLYERDVVNLRIPLSSIAEQQSIIDYLDRETARIDALIEKKRRMVELLELKLECEALQVTQSYGKVESLRRSLNRIQTGTTPSEDFFSLGDTDVSIPWITPGDFTARLNSVSISKSLRADAVTSGVIKVHPKDSVLVVGIGATAGRVSMADRSVTSNQQITGLVCLGRLLPRFLAWQLWARRQEVLDTAPYTTLPILNNEFLKSLIIFVPSLEEQEDVATRLDRLASRVGAMKERLDDQIARLIELRQALITAAVTGELSMLKAVA